MFTHCSASLCAILAALFLAACSSSHSLREPVPPVASVHSTAFAQAVGNLLGPGFTEGNRIVTLSNGAEIFPAMLHAIRGAQQTINFETYVFFDGDIPRAFAEALAERARAGVQVKAILDGYGSKKSRKFHGLMEQAGVELVIYSPLRFWNVLGYNYRTHRKLLIVDGRTGFIGGVGIGDEWDGDARSPEEWRDLHYRVEGPVVAQLQGAFADNWLETRGEVLQGPRYFPGLRRAGPVTAGVFSAAPEQGAFSVSLMYQVAIASARKSIYIESPYFLPDRKLLAAFQDAAARGVDVRIIMPGEHIDQKAVRRASRKRWPELLQAGVKLFEFEPTMIHTKLMIVDGRFTSIGSANFDPRSTKINDEVNMNVLDEAFAAEQTRMFFRDLQRSEPVDPHDYGVESITEMPMGVAQTPLESQL